MIERENKGKDDKVAPGEENFHDAIANDRNANKREIEEGDYTKVTSLKEDKG